MDALHIALAIAVVALAVANTLAYLEIREWRKRAYLYYSYCIQQEEETGNVKEEVAREGHTETPVELPRTNGEVQFSGEVQFRTEGRGDIVDCPKACEEAYERYRRGEISLSTLRQYYRRYKCPDHCKRT